MRRAESSAEPTSTRYILRGAAKFATSADFDRGNVGTGYCYGAVNSAHRQSAFPSRRHQT